MSTEEMFDVVDETDCVIGQCARSEVHRRGLRHRAVHILVFNRAGQLFLQKRSRSKDCFPGTWDSSSSGHLQPSEPYDQGAERELEEELGLTLAQPPERLFRIAACAETGQEFVWVYRGQAEGPFVLQPEEIEEGGWFTPAQIDSWTAQKPAEFAPAFLLIWRMFAESKQGSK